MATEIALTPVNGPYFPLSSPDPQMTEILPVASDPTNGNFINMGNCDVLVMFSNAGVGAETVTIDASADPYNRSGEITAFPLQAGQTHARIFRALGWEQSTGAGNLTFLTSSVDIEVAAVPLKG